jgi:hypothetical protein
MMPFSWDITKKSLNKNVSDIFGVDTHQGKKNGLS